MKTLNELNTLSDNFSVIYNDALKLVVSIGKLSQWLDSIQDNEIIQEAWSKVVERMKEELLKQSGSLSSVLSSTESIKEDLDNDYQIIQDILEEIKHEYSE